MKATCPELSERRACGLAGLGRSSYRYRRRGPDEAGLVIRALNEDPGGNRADALSNLWLTYVIVPPSNKWFIHPIRSAYDDSGHLWIPREWTDKVLTAYPFVFRDANECTK